MNAELEELVKAYDAFRQAKGPEARRLRQLYESLLAVSLAHRPRLSGESLRKAVRHAHLTWIKAQQKPTSMPPTA